ncbi:Os07g0672200 [Oryza sativa Japonica Group]|uniref:Os07g0672200 protein n=2 Tax=Oryza TaxID=4527 RepID=C7J4Q9_ORYSJ|nr:Os07g0672200 [Oryza sativa Japonica Group]|eukprot:NP_001175330.1 Os07g0672200 [Oryza sativa Japonica Group]
MAADSGRARNRRRRAAGGGDSCGRRDRSRGWRRAGAEAAAGSGRGAEADGGLSRLRRSFIPRAEQGGAAVVCPAASAASR